MSSQAGERSFLTHNYGQRIHFSFIQEFLNPKKICEKLTIYLVVENWNSKKTSKKMSKAAKRLGLGANDINRWGGEKNGNFSSPLPVKVFVVQCSANAVSDFGLLNGKRLVRKRLEYGKSDFPSIFYANFSWF